MFTTECAKINAEKPANTRNMKAQDIVHYLQSHFKTDFVESENGMRQIPKNKATAYMIAVSKAIFDPENWKNPCYAKFPECGDEWAAAAIIWYHGATPHKTFIGVMSQGYAC